MRFLWAILLFPLVVSAQLNTNTPWQVLTYSNITDVITRASPFSANRTFFIMGRNTPNDGGGGTFIYNPTDTTTTNLGTVFRFPSANGRLLRQYSGPLNALWFGATGTDSLSDQAAIDSAYALLVSQGGGTLQLPQGKYYFNLVVTNDNITIEGTGATDVNLTTAYGVFPADASRPIITVGDNTAYVNGFILRGLSLHALSGTTNCPGAVHFLGGAYAGIMENCQAIGGADTVKFKTGADFPSTINRLIACSLWEGTNSTIMADDTRSGNPASYTTRNIMMGGQVNGANTTGHGVQAIRGDIRFVGVQFDLGDAHAYYSLNGGYAVLDNCTFENASGSGAEVALIEFNNEALPADMDLSRYMQGLYFILGDVVWKGTNGMATNSIPSSGLWGVYHESLFRKPTTLMPNYISTPSNPYDRVFQWDMGGTNGPLWIGRTDGGDFTLSYRTALNRFQIGTSNTDTFTLFDFPSLTTEDANVRFFNETTTIGNKLIQVMRGNGTSTIQHQINAFGDSFLQGLTGSLGVGTNNPQRKLDVLGTARFGPTTPIFEVTAADTVHYGTLSFSPDNSVSIGYASAYRPMSVNVASNVMVGTGGTNGGYLTLYSTNGTWANYISVDTDGKLAFYFGVPGTTVTNLMKMALDTGWTGVGNKLWTDDGTFKSISSAGLITGAANVGGGAGVFRVVNGTSIDMHSLIGTNGTTVSSNGNVIVIDGGSGSTNLTGTYREVYWPANVLDVVNSGSGETIVTNYTVVSTTTDLQVLSFSDNNSTGFSGYTWAPPDEWDNSFLKFKIYWTATNGTPGDVVVWAINASAQSDGDTIAVTTSTTQTDVYQGADILHVTTAITPTVSGTPATGDMLLIRVARIGTHASDNKPGPAFMLGVKAQYLENTTGAAAW